jgi:fructan beta-fructosidase
VGEQLVVGYDKQQNNYFIDRNNASRGDFDKNFKGRFTSARLAVKSSSDIIIVVDDSLVKLFADNGLNVMTAVFFLLQPLNNVNITGNDGFMFSTLQYNNLQSIW